MSLPRLLRILLLLLLLADLTLLVVVSSLIGILPTIAILLLTALIGGWLLRRQGLTILLRVQESTARGELPAAQLLEGVALLIAAALLIVPGFLTDLLAIIGFVPALRRLLVNAVAYRVLRTMAASSTTPNANGSGGRAAPRTIEGECRREE